MSYSGALAKGGEEVGEAAKKIKTAAAIEEGELFDEDDETENRVIDGLGPEDDEPGESDLVSPIESVALSFIGILLARESAYLVSLLSATLLVNILTASVTASLNMTGHVESQNPIPQFRPHLE